MGGSHISNIGGENGQDTIFFSIFLFTGSIDIMGENHSEELLFFVIFLFFLPGAVTLAAAIIGRTPSHGSRHR